MTINKDSVISGALLLFIGGFIALIVFGWFMMRDRIIKLESTTNAIVTVIQNAQAQPQATQPTQPAPIKSDK